MRLVQAFITASLLLSPLAANADPLDQADRAIDDLDFDQAEKLYREALRKPGTREERLRAYRGLGLSLAFIGDGAGATDNFLTMLIIDRHAKVNTSLGPKIAKPFAAAKKALRSKKPQLKVTRDDRSGLVSAEVLGAVAPIELVDLHIIADGKEQTATVAEPGPATIAIPPHVAVKAWGAALDLGSGVIVQSGSPQAPLDFPATVRAPPAVVAVVEEAKKQNIQSEEDATAGAAETPTVEAGGASKWPLFVGGAAVAIAGGAAATYFLTVPPPLRLPTADHTGRLP